MVGVTSPWLNDQITLTDPRAMRALAHPVRMRLLGELRTSGPHSVGMLAEAVDEAPASVSYHLGTLARYGFVAEAPELARDRRERWWRATASVTNFDPATMLADPERHAASTAMRELIYRQYHDTLIQALAAEPAQGAEWVAAATHSDQVLHLDVGQLRELHDELNELFDRWIRRSQPRAPGAEVVTVIAHAFRRAR